MEVLGHYVHSGPLIVLSTPCYISFLEKINYESKMLGHFIIRLNGSGWKGGGR